jgi:hypothetical protein
MSSSSSSLVLGTAATLPPAVFEPFVDSLRATGFQGRLGLLLGHYGKHEIRQFERLADFVIDVGPRYRDERALFDVKVRALQRIRATRGSAYRAAFRAAVGSIPERHALREWRNLEYQLEGLQALRYSHYYEALREIAPDATEVFVTDVRDVIFQRDPFEGQLRRLEVFLEDESSTLGGRFNQEWITHLYGAAAAAKLASFTVSCSGTVIGPRAEMLHYLKTMWEAILWRRRPLGSRDQGVHNHLLRSGRFGDVEIVRNGTGRVLTMGAMARIDRAEDGTILNSDGTVPAVLHQYDRHDGLAEELVSPRPRAAVAT